MVATTFAADTPLAVTEMVARNGVAGNWLWWSMLPSGMLTVFFFARLWRRAEVMTDVEFVELRYSGRPAAVLRGFRAIYLGFVINLIIMGWVNLGMAKVMSGTLGLPKWQALAFCLGITFLYSILSGLWGVVVTDAVQFVIAMVGSIALAVFAVKAVGGLGALVEKLSVSTPLQRVCPWLRPSRSARPRRPSGRTAAPIWMLPFMTLVVYLAVNWWASWYPGAEPGGGGYVAQRIFSARGRAPRTARDALVQRRPLRPPSLAVDHRRAVLARSLPGRIAQPRDGPAGSGFRLRPRDERLPAGRLPRPAPRIVRGRLHEHDLDPDELGIELHRERLLPPVRPDRRQREALRLRVPRRDVRHRGALDRRDLLHEPDHGRLGARARPRRRHRARVHPADGTGGASTPGRRSPR